MIQVGSFGWSWRRFVEENLTKLCVHFQPRPAAWTHNFRHFSPLLIHPVSYDIRRKVPSQSALRWPLSAISHQLSALSHQQANPARRSLKADR